MAEITLPSQEYLRECFSYDADTGILIWKVRPRSHFKCDQAYHAWNTKYSLSVSSSIKTPNGYLRISINKRRYYLHRVIWKLVTGYDPEKWIDHKNRNRSDNRIVNLRLTTAVQSSHNVSTKNNSGTNLKGSRQIWRGNGFYSNIRVNGTRIHIGVFKTAEEAHAAYCAAAKLYFGEFWHDGK